MNEIEKENIERPYVEDFIRFLFDNENLNIERKSPPEPDFILNNNAKSIGIEVTSLVRAGELKKDVFIQDFIKDIRLKFEELTSQSIWIDIIIQPPLILSRTEFDNISAHLANLINHNVKLLFDKNKPKINIESDLVIDQIKSITIRLLKNQKKSIWNGGFGKLIPKLSKERIQDIINTKRDKPLNYKCEYDSIWLLIVERAMMLERGNSMSSLYDISFPEMSKEMFHTSFDKVFIYRSINKTYLELLTV